MLKNTRDRYGLVAKALHWGIALLIAGMAVAGFIMADMPRGPEKNEIIRLHASTGLLLLMLMTARLGCRLFNPAPAPPEGTPRWQARAAGIVHWGLYILIFAQIATGVMSLFTVAWNIPFFGLFEIPTPYAARDMDAHHVWETRHVFLFWSIAAFVTAHALAAAWHHMISKDNVLGRML